jgi:hypothetical protein
LARAPEPSTLAGSPSGKPHPDATPRATSERPNSANPSERCRCGCGCSGWQNSEYRQQASPSGERGQRSWQAHRKCRFSQKGISTRSAASTAAGASALRPGGVSIRTRSQPASSAAAFHGFGYRSQSQEGVSWPAQTPLAATAAVVVTAIPRRLEWSATMVQSAPRRPPRLFAKSTAAQGFLVCGFESGLQS